MKNLWVLIFAGLFPLFLTAQSGVVKGRLLDTITNQHLAGATISLLVKKDSSLFSYTLSDSKGNFEIKNIPAAEYILYSSFTGYKTFKNDIVLTAEKRLADLGTVIMQREIKTLTGVVVSDASPVKMNGDTISFKASAFNSRPDATVEDVLKKIPGVQVSKDGSVKAMGEAVQKIYVDGKEFFGNDPKLATKNLTADMVDQIQVFDDMSEQSRFTKIDDGTRSKSINIKLKKDRKKGDFGRIATGAGTDSRYEGNLSYNNFRDKRRTSVIGNISNTNKAGYTFNDFGGSSGSSQFSSGGSPGIVNASSSPAGGVSTPRSAGINFNDVWGNKIDFRSSYFYTDNTSLLEQIKFRRNSFPADSSSSVNSLVRNSNNNISHRINARLEYQIDSANSLLYSFGYSKQLFEGEIFDSSQTFAEGNIQFLAATVSSVKKDDRDGYNLNGELLYRKRFRRPGRTFTLGWRYTKGITDNNNNNRAPVRTYFSNGNLASFYNIDQESQVMSESFGHTISSSYTEPLGKNKLLEFNYAYNSNNNINDRRTYDMDTLSGKYTLLNLQQTNFLDYSNISNRAGFNFRHQLKKFNYQLGMGIQISELRNRSVTALSGKDTTVVQRFTNLFPTANFAFAITRTKNIRLMYRGRTNAPGANQLQDVPDLSNPLQIKTGNPLLRQEFVHNVNINYHSFAVKSQQLFSAAFSINHTGNKIVNTIDTIGQAILLYRPENVDGNYSISGMISYSFPVKKIKGLNLNFVNLSYYNQDVSLLFGQRNVTRLLQLNQSAGINYSREKFDFTVSGGFVYNQVNYNLNQGTDTRYFNQAYSADFTYRFKNRFFFLTDFDYFINSGRTSGFNRNIFLWNMSVAKKIFKTNPLEIKFTVYDLLKQNDGINRIVGENYYEDLRANVVPRFYMLTISYNLNKFGGRKEKTETSQPMMMFK